MSFEVIDNLFQVFCVTIFAVIAAVHHIRTGDRKWIILCCGYGCIALGTLYYVLHLIIFSYTPKVFYVAETAWTAAWLFLILMLTVRHEKRYIGLSWFPLICAATVGIHAIQQQMMGPAYVYEICFGMELASAVYHALYAMEKKWRPIITDHWVLLLVILQIFLFDVSGIVDNFQDFNIYFAVDIIYTLSMGGLLLTLHKEEKAE